MFPRVLAPLLALALLGAAPPADDDFCPPEGIVSGFCVDPGNPGFQKLYSRGEFRGWTHLPDDSPVDPPPNLGLASVGSYQCVDPAIEPYHIQVVWARASNASPVFDDGGRNVIRANVTEAMSIWNVTAGLRGVNSAKLKIACVGQTIDIKTVRLATSTHGDNEATVFNDLSDAGFNRNTVKYWVLYDHADACQCAGIALTALDDTPGPTNLNNGFLAQTAINFGRAENELLWLHELAHTMGAVQNSAPNTTGAGHCTDGLDVMCYNDRGPSGHRYTTSKCGSVQFDCGGNDYFHPRPQIGSYLSTHWNLASHWNRFHVLDPPVILPVQIP